MNKYIIIFYSSDGRCMTKTVGPFDSKELAEQAVPEGSAYVIERLLSIDEYKLYSHVRKHYYENQETDSSD